jgi:hypothetical protein
MDPDSTTLTGIRTASAPAWSAPWRSWLDGAIRLDVDRLRVRYELNLDEFRGLYISDEHVDRLLADRNPERVQPPTIPPIARETPLGNLAQDFDLSPWDVAALFISLAPELDRKYETLFAYLNDDVTRRFATVDLCRRLTGSGPDWLDAGARMFVERLLDAVRPGAASAWRSAAVVPRDPVRRFLLADGNIDVPAAQALGTAERRIASALGAGDLTCAVLTGAPGDEALALARVLAAQEGRLLIEVRVDPEGERWRDDLLTARLRRAWAYVALQDVEEWTPSVVAIVRAAGRARVPALLGVARAESWRRVLQSTDYELLALEPPDRDKRLALWRDGLRENGVRVGEDDLQAVAALFSLYPEQIRRAARQARRDDGGRADRTTLTMCARRHCATPLDEFADRVALVYEWADLVLPAPTLRRLQEFASAIRYRDKVFRDWAFMRAAGGSPSLRALFSGMSGTGKTMSAAVVANDLGVDLYRIDLSAVVSKYIGETEKNLERILASAEGSNAILFFDEADALFGKRSEVRDAHDRYANIEIAFLLQRMETYHGVMILATNLAKNLDEAFSRRIHFGIEFPLPDQELRERLWRLLIPAAAPTRDIDYPFLGRQFPLTGGEIRNVALEAAFLAAHEGDMIAMHHLVRAVARQRRKQGKLPTASEFKDYLAAIHERG